MSEAPEKHQYNVENLKHDFTPEERAENGRKGGIASGEARRRTRTFRDAMMAILDEDCSDKRQKKALEALGLEPTYRNLISLENIRKAARGDVESSRFVRDTVGEKPRDGLELGNLDGKPLSTLDMSGLTDEQLRAIIAKQKAADTE